MSTMICVGDLILFYLGGGSIDHFMESFRMHFLLELYVDHTRSPDGDASNSGEVQTGKL